MSTAPEGTVYYLNRDEDLVWRGRSWDELKREWNRLAWEIDDAPHRYRAWQWESGRRSELTNVLERDRLQLDSTPLPDPLRWSVLITLAVLLLFLISTMGVDGISAFFVLLLMIGIPTGLLLERHHSRRLARRYRYHLLYGKDRLYWASRDVNAIALKASAQSSQEGLFVRDTHTGEFLPWKVAVNGGWVGTRSE